MITPRKYQLEAIDAVFDYWSNEPGNPLVDLATGLGKSLVLSELSKRLITDWPDMRIVVATHVAELIEQSYMELIGIWPNAPAGIFSAGVGRRDHRAQILFAGIQTVHNKAALIGHVDVLMVDECFPAGTMVETPFGERPIETIDVGDAVRNATGVGIVEATKRSSSRVIVKMELSNGRTIECTKNHPFFTSDGWVKAESLGRGSRLFCREDLRTLRAGVPPVLCGGRTPDARTEVETAAFLLDLLLQEGGELHVDSRGGRSRLRSPEGIGSQTVGSRRERDRTDCDAVGSVELAGGRLDSGARGSDQGAERVGLSHLLQDRLGERGDDDRDRARRGHARRRQEGSRQEERRIAEVVRVVGVSIEERGRDADVFNLQVSGHPSYYAEGVLVHNCHLIPKSSGTMYGRFIAALKEINPDLKLLGLTATPFRLDSGRLDEGDDRLFDKVVYSYGIGEGIRDGYLAPLSSKPTETGFDMTGVGRVGGDYNQGKMQAAVDKTDINDKVASEIVARGQGRRSWLLFCAGVGHALHMRDKLRALGITCETVTGDTPREERRRIVEDFKAYRIQALTNNSVLTTGFNHKGVDLIAFCRPTLSAGLYLQMAGRSTRPLYAPGADLSTVEGRLAGIAAGPKPNALVLDFAGLVRRHGPVDMVEPKKPGKGDGEAPVKECPDCHELVHASVRICPQCGHEFEFDDTPKISDKPDVTPILSTTAPDWHLVEGQTFRYHDKPGGTPSVRIDYRVGVRIERTWVCPQHTGFAKSKADRWWAQHGGQRPFPTSVDEFLDRAGELAPTEAVKIKFGGKYNEIIDFKPGPKPEGANDNVKVEKRAPRTASGNLTALRSTWDDDIPF